MRRLGMAAVVLALVGFTWVPTARGQSTPTCPPGLQPGAAPTDAAGVEDPTRGLECVCPEDGEIIGVAGPDGSFTPTPQDDGDCATPIDVAPEVAGHQVVPQDAAVMATPAGPVPAPSPSTAGVLRRTG